MENEFTKRTVKLDRAEIALIISALSVKKCAYITEAVYYTLKGQHDSAIDTDELIGIYSDLISKLEGVIIDND